MIREFVGWLKSGLPNKKRGEDKRRAGRRGCSLEASWSSREAGPHHKAAVVDLAQRGLRMKSAEPLQANDYVKVRLSGDQSEAVMGRVVWSRRAGDYWVAGLTFIASRNELARSWVPREIDRHFSPERSGDRRVAPRRHGSARLELRDSRGKVLGSASMVDFSVRGIGIDTRAGLKKGQKVKLRFHGASGQDFEAVVKNSRSQGSLTRNGLEFSAPDTGRTTFLARVTSN